jgi:hypothetical protein
MDLPRAVLVIAGKLLAPIHDGELLCLPGFDAVAGLLECASGFQIPGIPFVGSTHEELRRLARRELADLAGTGDAARILAAGHQPELFHPGVWLKNFALRRLAARHLCGSVHIVVDNDVPKSAGVELPCWSPDSRPDDVHAQLIAFDGPPEPDVPYEQWFCSQPETRAAFTDRIRQATAAWPFRPFAVERPDIFADRSGRLNADWLNHARRTAESVLMGSTNPEIAVSRLSETAAFRRFVETLFRNAGEFRNCYNAALQEYRATHRIRSRHHPATELAADGEWVEAPFWCWSDRDPKRRRVFVRPDARGLAVRWGESLNRWPDPTLKIRPRALTLTLFVRTILADLFIHGIGGGIYDRLTDEIARRFFGAAPPAYLVLTGTLRLPLPLFGGSGPALAAARRRVRDLLWNPQRVWPDDPRSVARNSLIHGPTSTRAERKWRSHALRTNRDAWAETVADALAPAREQLSAVERAIHADRVLSSREYSWTIHPHERLAAFFAKTQLP